MFVAKHELLFPHAAPEAFRRGMFGSDFVEALSDLEAGRLAVIARDLPPLQIKRCRPGIEDVADVVRRHTLLQVLRKGLDPLAIAVLNTEIEAGRKAGKPRSTARIYLQEDFPTLNSLADLIAADLKAELQPLRKRSVEAEKQRESAVGRMRGALISGDLRFWVLNHDTGALDEGRPDFWRADQAVDAWAGKRIVSAGAPRSAVILQAEIDAYFALDAAPANDSALPGKATVAGEGRAMAALRAVCVQSRAGAADWPKASEWRPNAATEFNITLRGAARAWGTVAREFHELATPKNKKKSRRSG